MVADRRTKEDDMSGFFEDINNGIQQSSGRKEARLEAVTCGESEGKYELALYFNQSIFPEGLSNSKDDKLIQFFNQGFLSTRDDDDKQLTEGPYSQVEQGTSQDLKALSLRGPKKDVLELLRMMTNVTMDRSWSPSSDNIYQGLDKLLGGDRVTSDEELQILKATCKLPKVGGKPR